MEQKQREQLGKRIRLARLEKGMRQEESAKQLEISRSTLSYVELGAMEPDIGQLLSMAKLYGVALDYFIGFLEQERTGSLCRE